MDEGEILLLPSFSSNNTMNKERPRKKLWRNAVQVVASDDEDSDGHECTFFPAKRHCSTQLSEVDETRSNTVIIFAGISRRYPNILLFLISILLLLFNYLHERSIHLLTNCVTLVSLSILLYCII